MEHDLLLDAVHVLLRNTQNLYDLASVYFLKLQLCLRLQLRLTHFTVLTDAEYLINID